MSLTPYRLSLIAAILFGIVSLLVDVCFQMFWGEKNWLHSILISIFLMISGGIIFYILIEKYTKERIHLVYKRIFNITDKNNKNKDKNEQDNSTLDEIDRDMVKWANDKAKEIENLKQLEKYRKEFLGNVSHELKTPIFTIQGYVYTLLDGGLEDENINRLYLERTAQGIERMINIVNDLEAISKLESGTLTLNITRFNIVELTQDVFDHLEMKAKKRKITLCFEKGTEKHIYVKADKQRITQVLTNLIHNAISYGVENGYTKVRFITIENKVLVEVSDNGIGIEADDLNRIFERFYRCDKARSREQGGTGLGLAIVKHILEAHGQKINVTSTPMIGSTFSFSLDKG